MGNLKLANRGADPLLQRVEALVAAGATTHKIAIEAGVRAKELESWLDGAPPLVEGFTAKMAAWVEDLERPDDDRSDPEWVDTPSGKRIEEALEYARTEPGIAMIYGPPGTSKTTAARRYVKALGRAAVYFAASEFIRTPVSVLRFLAEEVGQYGHANRSYELANAIRERLPAKSVIVVDEAQHLSTAALDGLRWFHDEGGIGLAYLGNERVYTRIARGGRAAMFAQLHSRIGMHVNITRPEEGDVDAILEAWSVRGREERECALEIAADPGGLRVLSHVLRQARFAARAMKRPLDAALMRGALETRTFKE